MLRLIEARHNEIRSRPPLSAAQLPHCSAETPQPGAAHRSWQHLAGDSRNRIVAAEGNVERIGHIIPSLLMLADLLLSTPSNSG
jgi:hypothetical protein